MAEQEKRQLMESWEAVAIQFDRLAERAGAGEALTEALEVMQIEAEGGAALLHAAELGVLEEPLRGRILAAWRGHAPPEVLPAGRAERTVAMEWQLLGLLEVFDEARAWACSRGAGVVPELFVPTSGPGLTPAEGAGLARLRRANGMRRDAAVLRIVAGELAAAGGRDEPELFVPTSGPGLTPAEGAGLARLRRANGMRRDAAVLRIVAGELAAAGGRDEPEQERWSSPMTKKEIGAALGVHCEGVSKVLGTALQKLSRQSWRVDLSYVTTAQRGAIEAYQRGRSTAAADK